VTAHVRGWPAGDEHQAGGVRERCTEAYHGIAGASADRRDGGHRLSAHAVVTIGHMNGTLLVKDLDEPDAVFLVQERVGQRPDAVPRNTRYKLDPVVFERASDDLSTRQSWHVGSP